MTDVLSRRRLSQHHARISVARRADRGNGGAVAGAWKRHVGLTEPCGPIDCGNSGTGIRLMTGLLAGQDFFTVLTGDESIRRRPMGRVVKPLRAMGGDDCRKKRRGTGALGDYRYAAEGMSYSSPVASAQIKSSLLFAALYADGITTIVEPRLSRDHTERMFAYFGIPLASRRVHGSDRRAPVCRDGAARRLSCRGTSPRRLFLWSGRRLCRFGRDASRVGLNPRGLACLEILRHMGAQIDVLNPT